MTGVGFPVVRFFCICCLGFVCLAGPSVHGQNPEDGEFQVMLSTLWASYRQAKSRGDEEARDRVFQTFRDLQTNASGEIFETASYLFLFEGLKELDAEKYEEARIEFLNAIKLNPYLWPGYMGLAKIKQVKDQDTRLYVELNKKGIGEAFNPANAYFLIDAFIWFMGNLYLVFMVAFSAFVLILCVRYMRPFVFTTQGAMEHRGMKPFIGKLIGFLLLFLPLLLGLNFFLAAGLYLVLFFPFFDPREKATSSVALLLWILISCCGYFLTNLNEARVDRLLQVHLTQFFRGHIEQDIAFLKKQNSPAFLENQNKFTLAKLQKTRGELASAMDAYRQVDASSDLWPSAQINLGNIHYEIKEFQQAIEVYKRVLDRRPDMALAHYNLSVVHAQMGNHNEAGEHRTQARRLDRSLGDSVDQFGSGSDTVVDAGGTPGLRLMSAILGSDRGSLAEQMKRPIVFLPAALGLLFLIASWVHTRARNFRLLAKNCEKCGMVYYQSDSPNSEWCSQCVSLYIKKEDLPSDAKLRKHDEVKAFTKRKSILDTTFQIILPGSKNILHGNPWSGFIIVSVWAFLLVMIALPMDRIAHPFMRYIDGPLVVTWIFVALAAVYWVIFGLRPIWQED
ncbi:tetratricopeptide repeat protein [Sulfidibacter corallicola]|uniref:Tetratricopeptide repeat protein n=1 Tax=Sulfidibacter corallicola TaxID=2818388 RepID=A0A8A4TFZ0_SULCO|nr:tetratricopeptide repeat protein [Sulfidibacter corallicola]QTD48124.1 tetratricopeptide repeat protein [Sulfidibacter corallicola]